MCNMGGAGREGRLASSWLGLLGQQLVDSRCRRHAGQVLVPIKDEELLVEKRNEVAQRDGRGVGRHCRLLFGLNRPSWGWLTFENCFYNTTFLPFCQPPHFI